MIVNQLSVNYVIAIIAMEMENFKKNVLKSSYRSTK